MTDGRRIWMDSRQLQVERRCTLTHELVHIELGHTGRVSPAEEERVRRVAARRLVPFDALLDVAAWTDSLGEAAAVLWVDLDTLHARLDAMTADEMAVLVEAYRASERGA